MQYYYQPDIQFLLINHANEKVEVLYNDNSKPFKLPLISNRPPYYAHPRYEAYYPMI